MQDRIKRRFANMFDLPKDVLLDLSRIIVIGNMQICIENHRGIVEYSPQKIVIGCGNGQISVHGEDLSLRSILPEEIELIGHIKSVVFED
jgi:sporulation protein YqfC